MSDLRELYQEVILDHGKSPRNFRALDDADCKAHGYNPLCGDKFTVYLKVTDGVVTDATFQGTGCAISTASASMMTNALKGKSADEVERIFSRFHAMITKGSSDPDADMEELGGLAAFSGVYEFPTRVKCASLAWHTFRAALKEEAEAVVSTEQR